MPIEVATICVVTWAQAASAPSSRSPEQAPVPGPPTPTWAWASYSIRPMSTEQVTASSVVLPRARSVMREASGSAR